MCTDDQANFGTEAAGECPDQAKIGTIALGTPALDGPLIGSIYIGEPQPGNQYRLFMILSGFGINVKLVGTIHPDPVTGRLTSRFEDLPQVPFDDFDIHLFASDRGLMATPTRCTLYSVGRSSPLEWQTPHPDLGTVLQPRLRTGGRRLPRPGEAFPPAPGCRLDRGHRGCLQRFPRQTRPRRRRSVPPRSELQDAARLHGRPQRHQLLLRRSDPGRGRKAGSRRAGIAELSRVEFRRDLQRRRGPRVASLPRGRQDVSGGAVEGAPLSLAAITPALAGPYDYGNVVVRVAFTSIP